MDALAFPFRFSNGRAVCVDDQSEEYAAQLISAAVQTSTGELPIRPQYGSLSPEFTEFDQAGLILSVTNNYPNILIEEIAREIEADGKVAVRITFSTRS